jgi:hypothetical protein
MTYGTFQISQGASLEVPILVLVNGAPADLTNANFLSTLKSDLSLPDTDPTVIKIDWTEGSNPTSGLTRYILPPETTFAMTPALWHGLIRGENVPELPSVCDLVQLTVILTEPVSARFTIG